VDIIIARLGVVTLRRRLSFSILPGSWFLHFLGIVDFIYRRHG
jgi:hypothetical protein